MKAQTRVGDDLLGLAPEDLNRIGGTGYLSGDFSFAERCFLRALELQPEYADAWGNLGLVWQTAGYMEDALRCYNKAMELKPESATNLINLGFLTSEMGYPDNAIRLWEKALELDPESPRATANLSIAYLKKFDFERGWALHESRFRTRPPVSVQREYAWMKPWEGGAVRRLAVWPEQGIGDQILYATLIPELLGRGIPLVWELDQRLVPIFRRSFPTGVEFVAKGHDGSPFKDCDAHIATASIPKFYRAKEADFLGQPYRLLIPDPSRRMTWPDTGKKRIAISWRSFKPAQELFVQRKKSATLDAFMPLAERGDVELVDVQYGDVMAERAACRFHSIVPAIDLKNDIEGVLATIDACDAVVTTSNVTAHFAGALGKPTYLIYLRDNPPFFYWSMNEAGRSLWYRSVRCISAPTLTDWSDAVAAASVMIE